jgi:hypothetical protein
LPGELIKMRWRKPMNRIMALAIAGVLTAGISSAYADGEGNGNFGGIAQSANVVAGTEVTGVTGSNAYPVVRNNEAVGVVAGGDIPRNNAGIHESLNSAPPGLAGSGSSLAPNGATPGFATAESPVAAGGMLPPNGSNGILQSANSLPAGFQDVNGNPAIAFAAAQAAHRFAAAEAAHSPRG